MEKLKKAAYPMLSAIALFILSGAQLYNMRPFGTGAFLALMFTAMPLYVTAPVYFLSQALFCVSAAELWGYAAVCVCVSAVKLIFAKIKRRPPLFCLPLAAAVGFCGFIYAALINVLTPLNIILSALFSVLFAFVCMIFLRPVVQYKLKYKLLETELVCGCCILAAAGMALVRPVFGAFSFAFFAAAAATLFALRLSGTGAGVIVAISLGCGFSLVEFDPALIAAAVFPAALAAVFIKGHKLLHAPGYILGLTMAVYLFNVGDGYTLLSAALGCVVYICVPKKIVNKMKNAICGSHYKQAIIAACNRERRQTGAELNVAADIFSQMSEVMSAACGLKTESGEYAQALLNGVCERCPYGDGCRCRDKEVMQELMTRAVADGHTSVGGLPQQISDSCRNMGALMAAAGELLQKNKEDMTVNKAFDAAASLLSTQLRGAQAVMSKLGSRLCGDMRLDGAGAEKFMEELTYSDSVCSDAIIRVTADGELDVTAVVKKEGFNPNKAVRALKKIYSRPFFFVSDEECGPDGFTVARLASGAPLDVVFGVSQVSKDGSGVSGDTHSFTRIGASGFMMALSDGMGSGKQANEVSETAIGLVENYYKAGFDSQFVLSSVNRFLSMKRGESFSAMDVLVLDLVSGNGDVIKIGSPPTVVKRKDGVALIGGGSLPMGALEEISPFITSVKFLLDDTIVMVSDGVSDAFKEGELEAFIAGLDTLNPQTVSRAVLDRAMLNVNYNQSDDMTVICGRIYQRL